MRSRVSRVAGEASMHSLFLKIFLWFGLAMGLVITTLLLTVAMTRLERPFALSERTIWPLRAQLAATILEHNGLPMLAEYLQTLERAFRIQAYLFTENSAEVLGHVAPPRARQLAELAGHTDRMELQGTRRIRGLAQPVAGPSGRGY